MTPPLASSGWRRSAKESSTARSVPSASGTPGGGTGRPGGPAGRERGDGDRPSDGDGHPGRPARAVAGLGGRGRADLQLAGGRLRLAGLRPEVAEDDGHGDEAEDREPSRPPADGPAATGRAGVGHGDQADDHDDADGDGEQPRGEGESGPAPIGPPQRLARRGDDHGAEAARPVPRRAAPAIAGRRSGGQSRAVAPGPPGSPPGPYSAPVRRRLGFSATTTARHTSPGRGALRQPQRRHPGPGGLGPPPRRRRDGTGWPAPTTTSRSAARSGRSRTCGPASAPWPRPRRAVRLQPAFGNNLLRSPVELAQAVLMVQAESGGRAEAGVGAGWSKVEVDASACPSPRAPCGPGCCARRSSSCATWCRPGCAASRASTTGSTSRSSGLSRTPPPIVASVGSPWTMRNITPLVDRVELAIGRATRGGGESTGWSWPPPPSKR